MTLEDKESRRRGNQAIGCDGRTQKATVTYESLSRTSCRSSRPDSSIPIHMGLVKVLGSLEVKSLTVWEDS